MDTWNQENYCFSPTVLGTSRETASDNTSIFIEICWRKSEKLGSMSSNVSSCL